MGEVRNQISRKEKVSLKARSKCSSILADPFGFLERRRISYFRKDCYANVSIIDRNK
jgi:hypothetical protein